MLNQNWNVFLAFSSPRKKMNKKHYARKFYKLGQGTNKLTSLELGYLI